MGAPNTKKLTKLAKLNDSITLNRYDNGWMVEVGGRDEESDWKNAKKLLLNENFSRSLDF
jgi:hypothetical protein